MNIHLSFWASGPTSYVRSIMIEVGSLPTPRTQTHPRLRPCFSQCLCLCPLDLLPYLLPCRTDHLARPLHPQIHPGNPPASLHHPCPVCFCASARVHTSAQGRADRRTALLPSPPSSPTTMPQTIRATTSNSPISFHHRTIRACLNSDNRSFWFKLHAELGFNSMWVQQSAISLGRTDSCPGKHRRRTDLKLVVFPDLLRSAIRCPSALLAYRLTILRSALMSCSAASISYPLPCPGSALRSPSHGNFLSYALFCVCS